jgi:hypothetical protein
MGYSEVRRGCRMKVESWARGHLVCAWPLWLALWLGAHWAFSEGMGGVRVVRNEPCGLPAATCSAVMQSIW